LKFFSLGWNELCYDAFIGLSCANNPLKGYVGQLSTYKVKENPYLNLRSDVCHLELSGANPGKCTFLELEKLQSGIKRM
jgi:hypothetical protein